MTIKTRNKRIKKDIRKAAHGEDGINKFITLCIQSDCKNILDIGAGKDLRHASTMRTKGLKPTTIDFFENATIMGDYNKIEFEKQFDGIHAAHVLEHQPNPNMFLKKIYKDLKEEGWLCITVPPMKQQIVGGHVSLWNAGLILYHLILAGFDCSTAKILEYGYNISIVVQKISIKKQLNLVYDSPDMDEIRPYLPETLQFDKRTKRSFDGNIKRLNW